MRPASTIETTPSGAEGSAPAVVKCRHHWIIESPHGPTSRGRCKLCGAEREFSNLAPDYFRDDDSPPSRIRWSGFHVDSDALDN
jgi:hypothetical protein